jgi:hypothetical protein
MQLHVAMYKFKDVVQHVLEGLDEYFKMYFQQQQMQSLVIGCEWPILARNLVKNNWLQFAMATKLELWSTTKLVVYALAGHI